MLPEFQYRKKIPVAVLGATGFVGQALVSLLADHPWFDLKWITASDKWVGKSYGEALKGRIRSELSEEILTQRVGSIEEASEASLFFSSLDASVAEEVEKKLADEKKLVISTSRNHRLDPCVPLVVPEVNSDHLAMAKESKIVTHPNCVVAGMMLPLAALKHYRIKSVHVVTLQSTSGAGANGQNNDFANNVIPHIEGEEEKIGTEPQKILGEVVGNEIQPAVFKVTSQVNRVPVSHGHLSCVAVKFSDKPSKQDIVESWNSFYTLNLPSAPEKAIYYSDAPDFPQPKKHVHEGKGMTVCVGQLKEGDLYDYHFVTLSDNCIRGGAGGAILTAEKMVKEGYVFW